MLSDILVDTSVIIDLLRGTQTRETEILKELDLRGEPYSIAAITLQEVLQGAKSRRDWNKLQKCLSTMEIVVPHDSISAHMQAAKIYFDCRRKGITIGSSVDCMIAQLAIENDAALLHSDEDYSRMSRVCSLREL